MHDTNQSEPLRGSAIITSENRNHVRKWLGAQGVPYSIAGKLTISELTEAYNDTTDTMLALLKEQTPTVSEPKPQRAPQTATAPVNATQMLADAMAAIAASQQPQAAPIDESRIIELITEHAPQPEKRVVEIVVTKASGERQTMARQHYLFPLVMAIADASLPDGNRVPLMLVGSKGSGKSKVIKNVAIARGLGYEEKGFCQQSPESSVLGYMSATGDYVASGFRRAFAGNCVFLADEFDAANPNVAVALNNGTSNGGMGFPDAYTTKGADFWLVAAANTWGHGASAQYSGRSVMDDSTLDRYACLAFPYDEGLEAEICGIAGIASPECEIGEGGTPTANEWLTYVQSARKAWSVLGGGASERGCPSPRASIYGIALAKAGIGRAWLERLLIWRGLDAASVAKVKGAMR